MYKNELVVEVPGGKKWRVRLQDTLYKQVLRACETHGFPEEVKYRKPKVKPEVAQPEVAQPEVAQPITTIAEPVREEAPGKDKWHRGRGGNSVLRASFGRVWGKSTKTANLARALRKLGVEPRDPKLRSNQSGTGVYWQDATDDQLMVAWTETFSNAQG